MVVLMLKYIGPFLRINTLNKNNIKSQMFYFSKECLKNIVLCSKCGISITPKQIKIKDIPYKDVNIMNDFSPLLCLYKKSDSKLNDDDAKLSWSEKKQKKEVQIWTNSLMTLCLIELLNYYKQFEKICNYKYLYYKLYNNLCERQLVFYSSYLRNIDGVFVDKINSTEDLSDDLKFEEKSTKFKFSDQAIVMCALYKYSSISSGKYSDEFNRFSMDILNMFIEYKSQIYNQSVEELNKLCLSFNLFYDYSKNEDAKLILTDLCDFLISKYNEGQKFQGCKKPIQEKVLTFLNLTLAQKYINMINFKETSDLIFNDLIKLYNDNLGIFIPKCEDKKIKYTSVEIICYLIDIILYSHLKQTEEYNFIIYNIYKYQIINSGLILSWPEIPNITDIERYNNFSLKSDDLIDELNFIMPNISTFKSNGFCPAFAKNIVFNKKKSCFKKSKSSFYSEPNMLIFFLIIYLHNIYEHPKYLSNECMSQDKSVEDNTLNSKPDPCEPVKQFDLVDKDDIKKVDINKNNKDVKYKKSTKKKSKKTQEVQNDSIKN